MFTQDFYPTPADVIERMLEGEPLEGKIVMEPSAGKGDIVDYLLNRRVADVLAAELDPNLRKIVMTKCKVLAPDFLTIDSTQVSHVDLFVMNPPFSQDHLHILHAFAIAPPGCRITALFGTERLKHAFSKSRQEFVTLIENYGLMEELGDCFSTAERKTDVSVTLLRLQKPGGDKNTEFEGFFTEEEQEAQANAILPYNFIRDLVNRYVGAVAVYDELLAAAIKMNSLTEGFYGASLAMTMTEQGKPKARNDYKKELQKVAWSFVFAKMNMQKYSTKGLKEDINRFVEKQTQFPFSMKNIYHMLEVVIGTHGQRMDKALEEVFDKLTHHYHDNRYCLPGWKSNSHFMITEKFVLPWLVKPSWCNNDRMELHHNGNVDIIEDMVKAMCFLTGMSYDDTTSLRDFVDFNKPNFGQWYAWGYFEIKGFKKGTMHFKFTTPELWAMFNERIAKIKNYSLFEGMHQTDYQKRQTGRQNAKV